MKKQTKEELIKVILIIGLPVVVGIVKAFELRAVEIISPLGVPFWLFNILTGIAFGVGGYLLYKPCEYLVKKKLLRKRT